MGRTIGIDFGTTNMVAAVIGAGGKPVIIPNSEGERKTASVIAFDSKNSKIIVGNQALRQAVTNSKNTIFSIKRYIGKKLGDADIRKDIIFSPYDVRINRNRDLFFSIGEKWCSPSEILTVLLRKLKTDAELYLKEQVDSAVVTVPVCFNEKQRQIVKGACQNACVVVKRIINEPTAACLASGIEEGIVAVYHCGGGTLDISIVEICDGFFEVKSTCGNTHLGGDDFDLRIIEWMCDEFKKKTGEELRYDRTALQRLKWAAEKAKCDLSVVNNAEIVLTSIHGKQDLRLALNRSKLEQLVSDLIEKTLVPCEKALQDCDVLCSDVDHILLVGRQTRMPAIQKAVMDFFGREQRYRFDPGEIAALGAAVQTGILDRRLHNTLLLDAVPYTLSVGTPGGAVTPIIHRNSSIPTLKSRVVPVKVDRHKNVDFTVYQGEESNSADNIVLGCFRLEKVHRGTTSKIPIKFSFDIDQNCVLKVSARDQRTGQKKQLLNSQTVPSVT